METVTKLMPAVLPEPGTTHPQPNDDVAVRNTSVPQIFSSLSPRVWNGLASDTVTPSTERKAHPSSARQKSTAAENFFPAACFVSPSAGIARQSLPDLVEDVLLFSLLLPLVSFPGTGAEAFEHLDRSVGLDHLAALLCEFLLHERQGLALLAQSLCHMSGKSPLQGEIDRRDGPAALLFQLLGLLEQTELQLLDLARDLLLLLLQNAQLQALFFSQVGAIA